MNDERCRSNCCNGDAHMNRIDDNEIFVAAFMTYDILLLTVLINVFADSFRRVAIQLPHSTLCTEH
jgi:hypothetical protein